MICHLDQLLQRFSALYLMSTIIITVAYVPKCGLSAMSAQILNVLTTMELCYEPSESRQVETHTTANLINSWWICAGWCQSVASRYFTRSGWRLPKAANTEDDASLFPNCHGSQSLTASEDMAVCTARKAASYSRFGHKNSEGSSSRHFFSECFRIAASKQYQAEFKH